jgi:two-component sensor histidine kinase
VHRLVIRHIKKMGVQMTRFAANRQLPDETTELDMPTELRNIQDAFTKMADAILQDEALIEDAMRQKSVLLKEVYHRVKNNLQLISSILNMQIREAQHEDTKRILRRMQDRVLSLATIHRDLYQTTNSGAVNVGNLVREVVDKSVEIGAETARSVDVRTDIDEIFLFPDQAVPMSLLASEAATNAIKYAGATDDDRAWISVAFKCDDERNCYFELINSIGESIDVESTGMGAKLISAFAIQLGAQVEVEENPRFYRLTVSFKASEFEPDPGDF